MQGFDEDARLGGRDPGFFPFRFNAIYGELSFRCRTVNVEISPWEASFYPEQTF
jgi:hypothetical protein